MAAMIQQLWDIKLGRAVSIEDVPRRSLVSESIVSVIDDDGNRVRYRLYTSKGDETPYDEDTAHFKTRHNDDRPPFRVYNAVNGNKQPDLKNIAHELYTRWGDGYYRGFFIGGTPPMEYFCRHWIEQVT